MQRGDIYLVDLNPVQGREQLGRRYVLVVSRREFNQFGTPLVCPISQGGEFARSKGFAVALSGATVKVHGVVLCHQPRTLDLQARKATFVEKAPPAIVDEVIARLMTLLE
jgi:mRNA interferase ChpB